MPVLLWLIYLFLFQFEKLEDLQLLAENQQFLASLKILVCWQMNFEAAIKKLENGMDKALYTFN